MQREIEAQPLLHDGHQHIGGHGDPHLALHRVLRSAEETLDAQVLLDPLEEQFHLPAALVERADGFGGYAEVVGEKHQRLAGLWVLVANASQPLRVAALRVEDGQLDRLVADESFASIDPVGVDAPALQVRLGARHEEGPGLMQQVGPFEVEITPIHHVESTRLQHQDVEHIDVVQFPIRDVDEGRNGPAQIEQRMQLDRGLRLPERRPRKQRQAQVDGRRIQGIDRAVQFHRQRFVGIQPPRNPDQGLGELAMDAPVPRFVRIGQVALGDIAADAQVVELGRLRTQTGLDVAQTLPVGKLGEGHAQELIQATEAAHIAVAPVLGHQTTKGMPWRELHHLSEYELARVHRSLRDKVRKDAKIGVSRSNR